MDNIDKFLNIFSDFEMVIVPNNIRKEKNTQHSNFKTKANLKKALKRLEQEYKHALKSFKANKIQKNELYEFEWRIFELQEEIKRMENNDKEI